MGKNRNFYQNNEENIEVTEPVVEEAVITEPAPVETPVEAPVVEEVKPAEPIVSVKVEPEVKKVEVNPAPTPVNKKGIKEIKAKGTATL